MKGEGVALRISYTSGEVQLDKKAQRSYIIPRTKKVTLLGWGKNFFYACTSGIIVNRKKNIQPDIFVQRESPKRNTNEHVPQVPQQMQKKKTHPRN